MCRYDQGSCDRVQQSGRLRATGTCLLPAQGPEVQMQGSRGRAPSRGLRERPPRPLGSRGLQASLGCGHVPPASASILTCPLLCLCVQTSLISQGHQSLDRGPPHPPVTSFPLIMPAKTPFPDESHCEFLGDIPQPQSAGGGVQSVCQAGGGGRRAAAGPLSVNRPHSRQAPVAPAARSGALWPPLDVCPVTRTHTAQGVRGSGGRGARTTRLCSDPVSLRQGTLQARGGDLAGMVGAGPDFLLPPLRGLCPP